MQAADVYNDIIKHHPTDGRAIKGAKDASARASMQKQKWDENADMRSLMKDQSEFEELEKASRTGLTREQMEERRDKVIEKYNADPNHLATVKELAGLYEQLEDWGNAHTFYHWAHSLSNGDVALATKASVMKDKAIDFDLKQLEVAFAADPNNAELKAQLDQSRWQMAAIIDIEPAGDLGLLVADHAVVDHPQSGQTYRHLFTAADARRAAVLLAQGQALTIAEQQVALEQHSIRGGDGDAGLRAPGLRHRRQAIAGGDIVVGMQAVADLVEQAGVLVAGQQAVVDMGLFDADVEPQPDATVAQHLTAGDLDPAAQRQLDPAGFPPPIEILAVVAADPAVDEAQAMAPAATDAELAMIPDGAADSHAVLAEEGQAGAIALGDGAGLQAHGAGEQHVLNGGPARQAARRRPA